MGPPTLRYQGLDGATHSPVSRIGWGHPLSGPKKEMWMAPFVPLSGPKEMWMAPFVPLGNVDGPNFPQAREDRGGTQT